MGDEMDGSVFKGGDILDSCNRIDGWDFLYVSIDEGGGLIRKGLGVRGKMRGNSDVDDDNIPLCPCRWFGHILFTYNGMGNVYVLPKSRNVLDGVLGEDAGMEYGPSKNLPLNDFGGTASRELALQPLNVKGSLYSGEYRPKYLKFSFFASEASMFVVSS
jgi:hypothetical protein